jgi:group II intron reverse transcriptase/maturase
LIRAGSRQLALAFADSPSGDRYHIAEDESWGKQYLLHAASVNNRKDRATSSAAAGDERTMELVASAANLAQALLNVLRNKGASGVDGQTVEEMIKKTPNLLPNLLAALLQGTYRPGEIRRVWIPKPGGGQRGLGIPNVVDRWVQQAVLRILEPIFEPTFHPSSHGFRPNRGAHTAVAEAKQHLQERYRVVVHLDLSKFFDRVHYQRLLNRLEQRVHNSRILVLMKRMLTTKVVMPDGTKIATVQETPQGGPLSPLLSNVVLDEWDQDLGRRGLRFVHYADDCNIFVRISHSYDSCTHYTSPV